MLHLGLGAQMKNWIVAAAIGSLLAGCASSSGPMLSQVTYNRYTHCLQQGIQAETPAFETCMADAQAVIPTYSPVYSNAQVYRPTYPTPTYSATSYPNYAGASTDYAAPSTPRASGSGCTSPNYYGSISCITGQPRTQYVGGYFRKNGTYVAPYYRSKR